jgi:hypothetical protein
LLEALEALLVVPNKLTTLLVLMAHLTKTVKTVRLVLQALMEETLVAITVTPVAEAQAAAKVSLGALAGVQRT